MKIPDARIGISDGFIELQALMTERDGMTAENNHTMADSDGKRVKYWYSDFCAIAEKMRALKQTGGDRKDESLCGGAAT